MRINHPLKFKTKKPIAILSIKNDKTGTHF